MIPTGLAASPAGCGVPRDRSTPAPGLSPGRIAEVCAGRVLRQGEPAARVAIDSRELQAGLHQPLSGWMGHASPFDFEADYRPADGIARNLCGTPPMLSLLALECALEIWRDVDLAALRDKSIALTELFIALVERQSAEFGLRLASPRVPAERGSQLAAPFLMVRPAGQ